jgi:hypothetical protein
LKIWLIFFPSQTYFLPNAGLLKAGLFCHSCFINLQSLQQADKLGKKLTVREDYKKFKMYRKGKDIRKRGI